MLFKQETIKSWFTGINDSINNEVIKPFQNAEQVIWKYNQAIENNSLTQNGWNRILDQSDDSLKMYLTSIKGTTASMTGYTTLLQGNIIGIKKVSSAIMQYNSIASTGTANQTSFANAVSATNTKLGTYLIGLNGAKASLGGYILSLVGAKVKTIALQFATIALNTAITMGASLIISGIVSAISAWIHKTENIISASEDALNTIKSLNDKLKNSQKTINDTAKRFAELSQGVDQLTGKNISLSSDDYEEFLNLSNQFAEMFPTLTRIYNDNDDAIVQLSGDVDTIVGSLHNLIEVQRELTNRQIAEDLPTIFDGLSAKSDEYEAELQKLEDQKNAIIQNLDSYNFNDFSQKIHSGLDDRYFGIVSNDIEEYVRLIDDYESLLKDAELKYEIVNHDPIWNGKYDNNGLMMLTYKASIYIESSDEDIENARLTIDGKIQELAAQYETDIQNLNEEIKVINYKNEANWNNLSYSIFAWLSTDDSFKVMDDDAAMQATVQNMVNSLDWSSLDFSSWENAEQYIKDNILSLFNTTEGKQTLADIQVMLGIKTQFNNGNISTKEYQDKIQELLASIEGLSDETKKSIMCLFGVNFEEDGTISSDIDTLVNNVESKLQNEFDDKVGELTLDELQIAANLEVSEDDLLSWDELIAKINEVQSLKLNDESPLFTPTLSSSVEQISRQLEPQFSKLGDAYSSIFSNDGFNLDVVDNSMLENLREAFAEIDEEIGVTFDANKVNEFFDVIADGSHEIDEVQEAFNDLATAYFYSTDTLEHLNEATAESIKQQLEQMGVVNNEEIINHYLTLAEAENELLELQEQLAEAKKDLAESSNRGEYENARAKIDLIYEQIEAYYNEKSATEDLRIALFNLQLQQAGLSIDSIDSSSSVSELLRLASAAGLSAEYMDKLVRLQELINLYHSTTNGNMQSAIELEIQSDKSSLKDMLDVSQIGLEIDFPSGKDSGAGSAGKDAAEEYLEGFNNELDRLKFLQDNRIITEKEYLDQLRILYEKYFKDKEEYLEEYVKYEHEYLNGLKSLYEDVLGGITDLLDQQIDKTEEERDAKIDALEEEQEARTKVLEQQKEQLDLQIEEIEAQIKGKNDAIDAINDEIDAIRKANDERQRQIDLQKAIYDLERMQNQRTILQYSEDKGMHYVSDTSGIRDAKDAVDDAKREIEIAEKEKQIALIEDEISLLETRKSLIEDQQADLDKQIDALDEYYKKLIENTEAYYSALIQPIENYKTQFESIADFESDATFDEQLKSLGYSVDEILALSSSTLENFKSNYLGILSDIYAGNSQMLDSLSMISGLDQDEFVGYLSQSQPYIDSLSRLDLSSTQLAIDSANSGIYSFADGAVLATTNMTTMADTVTSLLEGDKKQAGIISSFETMTSVLADANTQIAGIASGMEELDGKTATIRINIETNGDTSLLGNAFVSGTAITGTSHVEGTALASGNWAVQSNEKNALVGELGRELIVRGGRFFTVGNYGAEMFNIKKGDIVFNHEQTEALLKNGHISGRGKAYADGTVGGGRILTADGRILRPLQESDKGFELLQKFQPLVDRIIKGEEGLITNAVFDSQKQFEQMLKSVMNTTAINNISNNRNSQPVVHQQFNITMPNITNSTSAEILMNDLQSLSTKKFQMEW